jgi:hypothetical protein
MIAFDLNDEEVTRSILTFETIGRVIAQAEDAGNAVAERGGGSTSAYDGDTGELMWEGPMRRSGQIVMYDAYELDAAVDACLEPDGKWGWEIIAVFKADDQRAEDDVTNAWWDHFCYTVGMPFASVWVPWASIEGRGAGPELVGGVLNMITAGIVMGVLSPGDSVRVPLGVAGREDDDDVISVWWIGEPVIDDDNRYQTNMERDTPFVVPIRWSSPLGWPDD